MTNVVPLPPAFLRPIAHRGLHDAANGVIENSAGAFRAAIAHTYGIECDLRPASGGLPVVFHDDTLDRLTTSNGPVAALTLASLAAVRHTVSGEPILTFAALLALVAGRVPLLVEVKSEWDPPNHAFLSQIAHLATAYSGPIALMSFDPAVVSALQTLAPAVPRGLVSGSYVSASGDDWWADTLDPNRRAQLRDPDGLAVTGSSFIAYEIAALPTPATSAARARGLPVLTWTVRTPADLARATAHADAPIFEGFAP